MEALPRLSFAPQFESMIAEGKKMATTRMLACKKDKLGAVSMPGVVCVGCVRARGFGFHGRPPVSGVGVWCRCR
jgi:hypothetical protein